MNVVVRLPADNYVCFCCFLGMHYTHGTNLTMRSYEETISEFIIPRNNDHDDDINSTSGKENFLLRIYNKRFDFPCLSHLSIPNSGSFALCGKEEKLTKKTSEQTSSSLFNSRDKRMQSNRKVIFDFTTELLLNFTSAELTRKNSHHPHSKHTSGQQTQRTIGIFNYGLHLQEVDRWMLSPMTKAIYQVAHTARQRTCEHPAADEDVYLYRETSSQAFSFSRGACVLIYPIYVLRYLICWFKCLG